MKAQNLGGSTSVVIAVIIWITFMLALIDMDWQIAVTAATMLSAIFLWVFSPFSLSFTSFLAVVVLVITGAIPLETGIGGFSTGAVFLILSGLMLAKAINETGIGKRIAYFILGKSGGTPGGTLMALFIILLILAFLVPSSAVRITLLLPAVISIIEGAGKPEDNPNLTRFFIIGLGFGSTVTGAGILPAALSNIIAVDLLRELTGIRILYTEWLAFVFPVSLALIPVLWFTLMRVFPPEIRIFPGGAERFASKLQELGSLDKKEKKCLIILFITLVLWAAEGLHGMHTAVPAMLAVVLSNLPGIGYADWEKMLSIEWGTVILVGFTLSLGTALTATGTAGLAAGLIFDIFPLDELLASSVLAVFIVSSFIQFVHLFLGNLTTVLVTMVPVIIEISNQVGIDPVPLVVVTGVTSLFGFLLPVQTISNIVIFGTGLLKPLDLIRPGIYLTFASILVLTLAAYLWWPIIGLIY